MADYKISVCSNTECLKVFDDKGMDELQKCDRCGYDVVPLLGSEE